MKKIQKYLNSSYPVLYQRWKTSLISCIIVFLILALFQPFGISYITHHKYAILLGYMVVTGMFLCIPVYLLPLLFPRFYDDKRWTVGRQIINQFLIFFAVRHSHVAICHISGRSVPDIFLSPTYPLCLPM